MGEPNGSWIDALKPPVALVMGGGASLGAIQVGMLRALCQAGVMPDMIVGTSAGALNASFMAQGFDSTRIDRLQELWAEVTREQIFPGVGVMSMAGVVAGTRRYLSSREGLEELTAAHLPETHEELEIPTALLASDIITGEKVILQEGDLRKHVTISACLPLIFEPVEHEGRTLIDGGVVSNVPVLPASHLGAKSLIVLDPGYPCALDERPDDLLGSVLHIVTLMIRHQSIGALHFLADDTQVIYVPPPCPLDVPPHDFSRSDELVASGYEAAASFLEDLEVDGPGIYGHPHFHEETDAARIEEPS